MYMHHSEQIAFEYPDESIPQSYENIPPPDSTASSRNARLYRIAKDKHPQPDILAPSTLPTAQPNDHESEP